MGFEDTTEEGGDPAGIKYDVFLSFRGGDTRKNFTAHLHAALTRRGVDAFIDDRLEAGERIVTLFRIISQSVISVVVFSPNYPDSRWCLEELATIAACRKGARGQHVLPVFLGVEPTHVRKQEGAFGDAFGKVVGKNGEEKVEAWRRAMVEVADLSGWDSMHKSEEKIVEEVVERIEKILNQSSLNDLEDGFVGSTRIRGVESLLGIGSPEGLISVGICGKHGIGKTAIAEIVFHRNSSSFDGTCFLENIRKKFKRDGFDSLQKQMVAQLLGVDRNSSTGLNVLSPLIQRRLRRKKLLIVLDDVSSARQLKLLVGRHQFLGPGSRIIVTSTDKQVLKNGCTKLYDVEKLNNREALELFKFHAFKQEQPRGKFIKLSKKIVACAKGLPLALEALGCNLYEKGLKEWESELAKLQEDSDLQVSVTDD